MEFVSMEEGQGFGWVFSADKLVEVLKKDAGRELQIV